MPYCPTWRNRPGLTALIDASTELAHTAILVANEPVVWVYCETPSLIKARSVVKKACDWSSACYRLAIPPGGEQEQSGTDTAIAVAKGSRTKNPRARGDAEQLQMAALLEHHGYSNGARQRTDPIPGRTLQETAGTGSTTGFFKKHFESHRGYEIACRNGMIGG